MWLFVAALATLALFQDRPWKPLEVFDGDGGGYYSYLPAAFIYHDSGRADSLLLVAEATRPGPRNIGLLHLPNGKVISKYPLGVALGQLPWFGGAHAYARWHGDPANGFSRPYQHSIMLAGLAYGLLGLWIVRKLLRRFFRDGVVAWALAGIGLGTNYFYYTAYEPAMAHAVLFLWQAALLYCTVRWYEAPRWRWALGIGLFLGLAVLCRPTEALFALVPLAWGLRLSRAGLRERGRQWAAHAGQLGAAAALALGVAGLQLGFWHLTAGQWLLDSYGTERFDFQHPHLLEGLFSFRKGWLLYSPLAGVALLGGWALRRTVPAARPVLLLLVPGLLYVTFSWEQWWYGGSFGARPLVSLYPLLALPLAALLAAAARRGWQRGARSVMMGLICLSLWQTWQYATGVIPYDGYTRPRYLQQFFRPFPH